jgi:DNA topoisomerase-1
MPLIVVESPTKARTFNRILKDKEGDYEVFATVGHFRDIPSNSLNIDYTQNFKPTYAISPLKEKIVNKLLELAAKHNNEVILATDEDREGESISYHIAYVLGFLDEKWPNFSFVREMKRIVFHEITPKALFEALENPTSIRMNLVKAQQARRILDRIVGYELSPLLWKKLGKNWLSAGRVQSVGLRLIVEREKEIQAFKLDQYFQIYGVFTIGSEPDIRAKLVSFNDVPYEIKTKLQLFAGEYEYSKTTIDAQKRDVILQDLTKDSFQLTSAQVTESSKYPPPPYSTSLLQIDAYQKLRYPSKLTMKLAQTLYERGLITYHRTDSFNLSANFVFKAKDYIAKTFGAEYTLEKPRGFRTKSKGAQQAHEAIRPTKFEKNPKTGKGDKKLSGELLKLYTLIFNRAIATQMAEAKVKTALCTVQSTKGYIFEKSIDQIVFDGFLKILNPEFAARHTKLPSFSTDDMVKLQQAENEESFTKAPPRYNDGSLVRTLEEKGIGRPSTYASIISNIQDKHYVVREKNQFVPTSLGTVVSDYLSHAFTKIFELDFTAKMEEKLDLVEENEEDVVTMLNEFYIPFKTELDVRKLDVSSIEVQPDLLDEKCPQCSSQLTYKYGKYGKFTACSNYPACKYIKKIIQYLEGQNCPLCQGRLVYRFAPKLRRRFFGCENYPTCKYTQFTLKPKEEVVAPKT